MKNATESEVEFDKDAETIIVQRVFWPIGSDESETRPMITIVTQIKKYDVSVVWVC
jgi:hypothetical protein